MNDQGICNQFHDCHQQHPSQHRFSQHRGGQTAGGPSGASAQAHQVNIAQDDEDDDDDNNDYGSEEVDP